MGALIRVAGNRHIPELGEVLHSGLTEKKHFIKMIAP